ncbi:restriction endonuclease [Enterococcus hermanniensis]|uniref:Restriction endonuclease type IV Mrr domain-containing protein n=1 Tax=Enterococcus hermanniensis TaxID=249189 RepID=A0A1L8TSF6_9ENTE|nr:restriction endonuclease [Enterococcus hermanniensis]OJG47143.1 hypothetical protein RV04_GL000390 [Enterococcus hermanniensis]
MELVTSNTSFYDSQLLFNEQQEKRFTEETTGCPTLEIGRVRFYEPDSIYLEGRNPVSEVGTLFVAGKAAWIVFDNLLEDVRVIHEEAMELKILTFVESNSAQITYNGIVLELTDMKQWERLSNHVQSIEKEAIQADISEYQKKYHELLKEHRILFIRYTDNFITKFVPQSFFYDLEFLYLVDECLLKADQKLKAVRIIDYLTATRMTYAKEHGYEGHELHFKDRYHETIKNFELLKSLFKKKMALDEATAAFVTHQIFWSRLKHHGANEWHKSHGASFRESAKNLAAYIEVYSVMPEIIPEDMRNITLFTLYLMEMTSFLEKEDYVFSLRKVERSVGKILHDRQLEKFEQLLLSKVSKPKTTIEDIDQMSNEDFKVFIAGIFRSLGYGIEFITDVPAVDLIATIKTNSLGIQVKQICFPLGDTAIQEVIDGVAKLSLHEGLVVTNATFTKSATELAKDHKIVLWDRKKLIRELENTLIIN